MKISLIVGARPQFIKLAPLYNLISNDNKVIIIHTGQHFDSNMSMLFFKDFDLPEPDYNLKISGGTHGNQTGRMLIEIEKILFKENPDLNIVFGDTNSTLAGALAASKIGIKSIHIESGLRSFNMSMPEEINRIVSDHICDFLFAPTKTAMKNLKKENLFNKAFLTGDIMTDSLKIALEKNKKNPEIVSLINEIKDYYLLTLHRPYNVDNPKILDNIIKNLAKVSNKVLFPIHPRTKKVIYEYKLKIPRNFIVIKPLGYFDFIFVMKNALKIITDSGGIQKEAYIMKKPCITLRTETEWVETIKVGWNLLINHMKEIKFYQMIENFYPTKKYIPIFGNNVAKKMNEIIKSL